MESKQNRGRVARTQKPETLTVRADPCPARFHLSVHQQQHNYAAPSPDSDLELDDETEPENSPLETFLAAQSLGELVAVFKREKIDLQALLLCSDRDLNSIHVPLGPRKKLLDACRRRVDTLKEPEAIADTEL